MGDDITQPFGGAPSTSTRYGQVACIECGHLGTHAGYCTQVSRALRARVSGSPMTGEELARRVFQAEQRVMSADGRDIANAEVVLSPDDYLDIVVEERRHPDQRQWLDFDFETGQYRFRGHLLRMNNDLARGDVRLRTEVAA